MRITILGGSSIIGSRLVETLEATDYTYFNNKVKLKNSIGHELDIRDRKATLDFLGRVNPDIVLHTVALPGMDLCETDKKLAHDINVEGTRNIVEGCRMLNSKIIFTSTSAVFDGKKTVYTEEDQVNPISYHGITKAGAEKVIIESGIEFLILRMDHPYGWVHHNNQRENTVTRVLKKLEKGEIVEEITDWYNNPTFVDNLSDVIKKLIEKDASGVYHTAGPDFLNRYDFALNIIEVFGKDKNLIKGKGAESLDLPARRTNCNLSSKKAEEFTGMRFLGVKAGLEAMRKQKE